MKIIVDAMGSDKGPAEIVKGAVEAVRELGVDVIIVGQQGPVNAAIKANGGESLRDKISVVNAEQVVEMCDDPTTVLRAKKDSSMYVALSMLKNGEGDACISAGSTGALLSGATLIVKRIKGIRRAAMAPVFPNGGKGVILIDCGANTDCTSEYLLQFAYMGSFYSKEILGCDRPRVALLNNGTESSKGDALRKETYALLKQARDAGSINFTGNVEAKEILSGSVDVVVTDGFTGNILLKSFEGMAKFIFTNLKGVLMGSVHGKLGALMVKNDLGGLKSMLDPNEVGGTAMLGITKPVIKAHGSSDARAIKNAIRQAVSVVDADVTGLIEKDIELMKL